MKPAPREKLRPNYQETEWFILHVRTVRNESDARDMPALAHAVRIPGLSA